MLSDPPQKNVPATAGHGLPKCAGPSVPETNMIYSYYQQMVLTNKTGSLLK